MKVFQEKISNANASEYIEIKLSKPEFSSTFIFIKIAQQTTFG